MSQKRSQDLCTAMTFSLECSKQTSAVRHKNIKHRDRLIFPPSSTRSSPPNCKWGGNASGQTYWLVSRLCLQLAHIPSCLFILPSLALLPPHRQKTTTLLILSMSSPGPPVIYHQFLSKLCSQLPYTNLLQRSCEKSFCHYLPSSFTQIVRLVSLCVLGAAVVHRSLNVTDTSGHSALNSESIRQR